MSDNKLQFDLVILRELIANHLREEIQDQDIAVDDSQFPALLDSVEYFLEEDKWEIEQRLCDVLYEAIKKRVEYVCEDVDAFV